MSLLTVESLSLTFGPQTLFDNIGFAIAAGDRVGLVGRNGMGKSSLFKAIAGNLQPDAGQIRIARGIRLGYLPQDVAEASDKRILDSVLAAVPGRAAVEKQLIELEHELNQAHGPEREIWLQRVGELQLKRDHYEVCYAQHEAERILSGLGFERSQFDQTLRELSGGWRMRAALAALLFQQPDLLLLDEPTNHLDLPSVQWFDGFLQRFAGAFLLVSHDRELLNRQIRRVVSLELEGLRTYTGSYDDYERLRNEEDVLLRNRAKNIERERREIERFVVRFKAQASKARAASSKAKVLRKMDKVQTLEIPRELAFRFPTAPPSGRQVLHIDDVSKSFGANVLYQNLDLRIYRGDRVALVGANGKGKTTLLRIISDEIKPETGSIQLGHQVVAGYYAQHSGEQLHPALTVLQSIWSELPDRSQSSVRGMLSTFLFSGDDALKTISMLSGGEKARVALARLVATPTNLLLLDEPTGHLDLNAAEALADAMASYDGSLLLVSHHLGLLRRVATKIWELRDGAIHEYLGSYDDYVRARQRELEGNKAELEGRSEIDDKSQKKSKADHQAHKRIAAQRRQEQARLLGDIPKRIAQLEERIANMETEQSERERILALPETYADQARYQQLLHGYNEDKSKIQELMGRWEHLEEERAQILQHVQDTFGAESDDLA